MINRVGITATIENNPPSSINNVIETGRGNSFSLGVISEIIITPDQIKNTSENPGGVSSLGAVRCSNLGDGLIYPLYPNIKTIPTLGEVVVVVGLDPQSLIQTEEFNEGIGDSYTLPFTPQAFYLSTLNLNGSNFLNIPIGIKVKSEWSDVFNESLKIHKLIPQVGDTTLEGRFGNSIRLSGTLNYPNIPVLSWSELTENGNNNDPIIVFRNGQDPAIETEILDPTLPVEEDINGDLSSIYMTSYQKLPIEISKEESNRFISYTTPPVTPNSFSDPQIIGNSDRILLNAKKDSILLSAQKSVGLLSNESINLESTQINIQSKNLKLGSKSASESALYGDKTVQNLKSLINILRVLVTSTIGTDPKYSAQSTSFLTTLDLIDTQFDNCKSKNVKID